MQLSPEKSNSRPYISHTQTDKFARVDYNSNIRNAEYYTPLVSTYRGSQHPQFGKSPITSVQMNRKNKKGSVYIPEGPSIEHESASFSKICSGYDWKKILFWTLIALAIIGLIIGLIFLIKALTKNNENNIRYYRQPEFQSKYTGINPVYVSPVPYRSLEVPTTSGYVASVGNQNQYGQTPVPITEPTRITFLQNQPAGSDFPAAITQPAVRQTGDYNNNFVNPLDVYNLSHD